MKTTFFYLSVCEQNNDCSDCFERMTCPLRRSFFTGDQCYNQALTKIIQDIKEIPNEISTIQVEEFLQHVNRKKQKEKYKLQSLQMQKSKQKEPDTTNATK